MLSARTTALIAGILCAPLAQLHGQNLAQQCVNGAPAIPSSIQMPGARDALERLASAQSYADYGVIARDFGELAAFDSIALRGQRLLGVAGDLSPVSAPQRALEWQLARLRRSIDSLHNTPGGVAGHLRYSALSVSPSLSAAEVEFVNDSSGAATIVAFDAAHPVPAIALCAIARTMANALTHIDAPEFQKVANEYATALKHWNIYIQNGYSMTLVERLGNSCRLGILDWVVAPTAAHRCGAKPWKTLGPPTLRTIFVHPSAGLAPVFDTSSAVRGVSMTEWYGLLWTPFYHDRLIPVGASIATMFPVTGRPALGGVLHTPIAKIGVFRSGDGPVNRRGRIVLEADLVGWVPGNRSETANKLMPLFGGKARTAVASVVHP